MLDLLWGFNRQIRSCISKLKNSVIRRQSLAIFCSICISRKRFFFFFLHIVIFQQCLKYLNKDFRVGSLSVIPFYLNILCSISRYLMRMAKLLKLTDMFSFSFSFFGLDVLNLVLLVNKRYQNFTIYFSHYIKWLIYCKQNFHILDLVVIMRFLRAFFILL